MLTTVDAKRYLTQMGITTIPDFLLELLVEQSNSANECLDAHYPENTAKLIRLYLLGLLGISQMTRQITSERAPSGAGRSWTYADLKTQWAAISGLLNSLDKHGCTTSLQPDNPAETTHLAFFTVTGGCHE